MYQDQDMHRWHYTLTSWKCFLIPKLIQTFAEVCKRNNSLKSPMSIVRVRIFMIVSFIESVQNIHSNSRVGFFVVTSLHIWGPTARENILSWSDIHLLIFWKLKIFYFFSQKRKYLFHVGSNLQKHFPLWWKLGFTCQLSSLTCASLLSGWFFQTLFLVFFNKLWDIFKMQWNIPPWSRWRSFQHRK